MAQNGAVIVFCSSCKILYFASSVHPKIATELWPESGLKRTWIGHTHMEPKEGSAELTSSSTRCYLKSFFLLQEKLLFLLPIIMEYTQDMIFLNHTILFGNP